MKKSFKLFISLFIITAMSLYLAYIDKSIYSVFSEYAEAHLNNPQQYLYIVTIYAMCVLWAIYIPYLEPCFYLRNLNLIEQINKRNIYYSFLFGAATFFLYFFTAILVGYSIDFNGGYFIIIFKLILYYFMCFELSTTIYLLFNKMVVSILSLYLVNLAIICIYYAVDFYVYSNELSENLYRNMFLVYTLVLTIICLLFNEFYAKRKDIV